MGTSGIDQALEVVESLPQEEQRLLVDLVEHRIAERRRAEIAENARQTRQALRAGTAAVGSFEDLRRDLETSN